MTWPTKPQKSETKKPLSTAINLKMTPFIALNKDAPSINATTFCLNRIPRGPNSNDSASAPTMMMNEPNP